MSVSHWDISCDENLDTIKSQTLPWNKWLTYKNTGKLQRELEALYG